MRPGMSPGTDCSPSMPLILRVPVRTITTHGVEYHNEW